MFCSVRGFDDTAATATTEPLILAPRGEAEQGTQRERVHVINKSSYGRTVR